MREERWDTRNDKQKSEEGRREKGEGRDKGKEREG